MPMILSCNGCQARLQLPDQFQGAAVRCASCNQIVHVPNAAAPASEVIACPACKAMLRVPAGTAGQQIRCPTCAQPFTVGDLAAPPTPPGPTPENKAAIKPPPLAEKPAPPTAQKPSKPPAGPTITFQCRGCKKSVRVPEARAGSTIKCPGCGQANTVPAVTRPAADESAEVAEAPPKQPARLEPSFDSAAVLDASPLSEVEKQRLKAELTRGEQLLWAGRPDPALAFRKGLFIMGGWLFSALFMGVGAGLIFNILTQEGKTLPPMGVALLVLLGGLALLSGTFAVIYPFHSRKRFRGTFYAITAERALVFAVNLIGRRRTETYRPADLRELQRKDIGTDGSADLIFRIKEIKIHTPGGYDAGTLGRNAVGQRVIVKKWEPGSTIRIEVHYGFLNLRDADAVEKILCETLLELAGQV